MAGSCQIIPTLTRTDIVTTESLETATTSTLTTGTPTTVTTTISCSLPAGASGTCSAPPTTVTSTIPGGTSFVDVPTTITHTITSTNPVTLFSTSCPDGVSTPPPPSTSSTTSAAPIVTTKASTTVNGNGETIVVTLTETLPPSSSPSTQNPGGGRNGNSNNTALGPIIGGAVGGVFGLAAIVILIWFIMKRRRRWDDIFDKGDDDVVAATGNQRFSLDEPEPKPYQYGIVGQVPPPPKSLNTPPHSPPQGPGAMLIPGIGATYDSHNNANNNNNNNGWNNSYPPLSAGSTASGPSIATISSRPSTAGSNQPLRAQQQGIPGVPFYPPRPGEYFNQQPNQGTANTGPSSHGHSISAGSLNNPPMTHANWNSSPGPGFNSMRPTSQTDTDDSMYHNRSGSPLSLQEPRRLQVANSLGSPPGSAFSTDLPETAGAAAGASGPGMMRDGKGRLSLVPERAPFVHADGGSLQGGIGTSETTTSTTPRPPAYNQ